MAVKVSVSKFQDGGQPPIEKLKYLLMMQNGCPSVLAVHLLGFLNLNF